MDGNKGHCKNNIFCKAANEKIKSASRIGKREFLGTKEFLYVCGSYERSPCKFSEECDKNNKIEKRADKFAFSFICIHKIADGGERNYHDSKRRKTCGKLVAYRKGDYYRCIKKNRKNKKEFLFFRIIRRAEHYLRKEIKKNYIRKEKNKIRRFRKDYKSCGEKSKNGTFNFFRNDVEN